MAFDTTIPDLAGYTARMALGMDEKLFFLDPAIEAATPGWRRPTVIVDFGCADGATLRMIAARRPDIHLVGFDISPVELELAAGNLSPEIPLFSDWDALEACLAHLAADEDFAGGITLMLSSVIHEVYAYGTPDSIATFWRRVETGPFDQVIVRDMACHADIPFASEPDDVARLRAGIAAIDPGAEPRLDAFEALWGPITGRHALLHFLLKYRYAENWDRELGENYLPLSAEALVDCLAAHRPLRIDSHTHAWTAEQVIRDFGIELRDATHLKALFTRAPNTPH